MMESTYLVVGCEHVEDQRVCDDNVIVYLESKDFEVESDGVLLHSKVPLPEGWTTVVERGGRWLRCPKHSETAEAG